MQIHAFNQSAPLPVHASHVEKAAVALNGVASILAELGSEFLAAAAKVFAPQSVTKYEDFSKVHRTAAITRRFAFSALKDVLIASSVNRPRDMDIEVTTYEMCCLFNAIRQKHPLLKDTIGHGGYFNKERRWASGICTGMCMEFMSDYFRDLQYLPHEQALLETARRFTNGASKRAVYSNYLCAVTGPAEKGFTQKTVYIRQFAAAAYFPNLNLLNLNPAEDHNFFAKKEMVSLKLQMETLPEDIYVANLYVTCKGGEAKYLGHAVIYSNQKGKSFVYCPDYGAFAVSQTDATANFMHLLKIYSEMDKDLNQYHDWSHIYFHPIREKLSDDVLYWYKI